MLQLIHYTFPVNQRIIAPLRIRPKIIRRLIRPQRPRIRTLNRPHLPLILLPHLVRQPLSPLWLILLSRCQLLPQSPSHLHLSAPRIRSLRPRHHNLRLRHNLRPSLFFLQLRQDPLNLSNPHLKSTSNRRLPSLTFWFRIILLRRNPAQRA